MHTGVPLSHCNIDFASGLLVRLNAIHWMCGLTGFMQALDSEEGLVCRLSYTQEDTVCTLPTLQHTTFHVLLTHVLSSGGLPLPLRCVCKEDQKASILVAVFNRVHPPVVPVRMNTVHLCDRFISGCLLHVSTPRVVRVAARVAYAGLQSGVMCEHYSCWQYKLFSH